MQAENGATLDRGRRGEGRGPLRLEIRERRGLNAKTAKTPSRNKAGAFIHVGPGFQPLPCLRIGTWGVAPGWYEDAPLALTEAGTTFASH